VARPSKLNEKQWLEIERRLLAGEKPADLAREFGVNRAAITRRFSQQHKTIKHVANQLVTAEDALRALPVAQQITALNIAEQLRSISQHLCSAANYGAMTAHRLSGLANQKAAEIDPDIMEGDGLDDLKMIAGLTRIANDSAEIGLNLLKANKEAVDGLSRAEESPLLPTVITIERRSARIAE
jgi:hypothetical protein